MSAMSKVSVSHEHLLEPAAVARGHLNNFEQAIQDTLSALANVEARYQNEREQVHGRLGREGVEALLQQELEERHRKEREPLVQQLAGLHQRTMTLTMFRQR